MSTKSDKVWELMRLLKVGQQFDEEMTAAGQSLAIRLVHHEKERGQIREKFSALVGASRSWWLSAHHDELSNFFREEELDELIQICRSPAFERLTEFDKHGNERIQHLFTKILRFAEKIVSVQFGSTSPRRRIGFVRSEGQS